MTNRERPSDVEVSDSVELIKGRVVAKISRARQRRKRFGIAITGVLGGALLFGGGLAVGAAALAPTDNEDTIGHPSSFTVYCYSADLTLFNDDGLSYSTKQHLDNPKAGPAEACEKDMEDISQLVAPTRAHIAAIQDLRSRGITCGSLIDPDGTVDWWQAVGGDDPRIYDTPKPLEGMNSITCPTVTSLTPVELAAPLAEMDPTFRKAACTTSGDTVYVYPLKAGQTQATMCRSQGEEVWSPE